jgi:hypothetical protein
MPGDPFFRTLQSRQVPVRFARGMANDQVTAMINNGRSHHPSAFDDDNAVSVSDLPVPLGTMASTGDVCPETGWWICLEGGMQISRNDRRRFEAGSLFPYALCRTCQADSATNYQGPVPVTWRLVSYDKPSTSDQWWKMTCVQCGVGAWGDQ